MQRIARASCLAVASVGSLARHVLDTEPSGTVLASNSGAVFLVSARGELVWLAAKGVPMHRRGVGLTGPAPRTAAGSSYRVTDAGLQLGSGAVIDLSQAAAWAPERGSGPPVPIGRGPSADPVSASRILHGLPAPTGFGAFLPALIAYGRSGASPGGTPRATPALAHASPHVFGLARACRARDGAALLEQAANLVGLGEGLTPSGDDFVGGVLFGLALLRDAGVRLPGCTTRAVASLLESSRQRTNRVSFALLADHAAGHSCEPAHRVARGLLGQVTLDDTRRAAADLVRVGHSTGWDVLTGLWTASALIPRGQPSSGRMVGPMPQSAAP